MAVPAWDHGRAGTAYDRVDLVWMGSGQAPVVDHIQKLRIVTFGTGMKAERCPYLDLERQTASQ